MISEPLVLSLGIQTDGTPEGTHLVDRATGQVIHLSGVRLQVDICKPIPRRKPGATAQEPLASLPHEASLHMVMDHVPVLVLPTAPASFAGLQTALCP